MVPDFRRDDVWTPAFAGVTPQETFYENINFDDLVKNSESRHCEERSDKAIS
jgi:hypothetical protein